MRSITKSYFATFCYITHLHQLQQTHPDQRLNLQLNLPGPQPRPELFTLTLQRSSQVEGLVGSITLIVSYAY